MLGRKKTKEVEKPPVFVDMSVYKTELNETMTVRTLHIYEEKDLRLIQNSMEQGHIVTVDVTVFGGSQDAVVKRVAEIADNTSSTVCEAGPGVYLMAPAGINVERMRAR